jgi:ubiquitin-protein ligase
MATPQEVRKTRLKNDYRDMCNIRGAMITWHAVSGTPPFVDEYRLTVNVRSIVGPGPTYRDQHVIDIKLPAGYPMKAPPEVVMVSQPVVFHPNWWSYNNWCPGLWDYTEGLGAHIIRMIRTLQYDAVITNEHSAANTEAKRWYLRHRDQGIFPCDRQTLPDPSISKFEVQPIVRKKFDVRQ